MIKDNAVEFVCSLCGHPQKMVSKERYTCPVCGGSIEPVYDFSEKKEYYRRLIQQGSANGIWGYRDLLPVAPDVIPVSLGEGNTPLLQADNLAKNVGIQRLYLKNETLNPSHTYKDRFATIAVSLACNKGKKPSHWGQQVMQLPPWLRLQQRVIWSVMFFCPRGLFGNGSGRFRAMVQD